MSLSNLCAICQSEIAATEAKTACPDCHAEYHADCWQENRGCAIYGCSQVPATETRRSVEIPVSFWGQEQKPCPACGRQILAAALRCRHCGATFASARPEERNAFLARSAQEQSLPDLKRKVIRTFVLCVIPCVSPIGAIYGFSWYPSQKRALDALPSLYPALCKIGLGAAIIQIVLLLVMAALYAAFRSS